MNSLIYNSHDTERYMPTHLSDDKKEAIFNLMLQCIGSVEKQMPIGLYYNNNPRLILPHSVFLQERTPNTMSEIVNPTNFRTRMQVYTDGARQAIGMDVDQILSGSRDSRNGWKTLHFDRVNDSRIMTLEEMYKVFNLQNDAISDDVHLLQGFTTTRDFIRNWNHWFRIFLAQTKSQYDLIPNNK